MKKQHLANALKRYLIPVILGLLPLLALSGPPAGAQSHQITVDVSRTYQTLEGFGAACGWYHNWLTEHPFKMEIYDLLFNGLGLDIYRFRNRYRNTPGFGYEDTEIIQMATASLGRPIKTFLSSWTPPADIKANGVLNGGTLVKENGAFVYDKFADYWANTLTAYAAKGINLDYISIQNEPDYENSGWETCIFKATESNDYPGYGSALDAVHRRLQTMANPPKILAPEVTGILNNLVQNYCANLDLSQVYGIAHHLYNGGDPNNPDSFIANMTGVAAAFPDKPLFQTEYDQGTPFTTALLMHHSLVEEGISAYFFWDLIWTTGQRPLIALEDPWNQTGWSTEKGYIVSDFYHVFKHYSKFTDPGFKRIAATADSSTLKSSAFISPDGNQLTLVLINSGSSESRVTLNLDAFESPGSEIYRTTLGENEKFAAIGSLGPDNGVTLPAQSIATVVVYSPSYEPAPSPPPLPTPTPPPDSRSAFEKMEAESYNGMSGIQTELIDDSGGRSVSYIENGDYLAFTNVDFGNGAAGFTARASSGESGGYIEIRLDNPGGALAGTCVVSPTGGWSRWAEISTALNGVSGVHDLYLRFSGGSGYLFNLDWFQFTETDGEPPVPSTDCAVAYRIVNDWGSGATVNVTIRNRSAVAINGWTLAWTFPGNQQIGNLWNGSYTQNGAAVAVTDTGYNGTIAANGGTVSFGFNLTYNGVNALPVEFTLNDQACTVE